MSADGEDSRARADAQMIAVKRYFMPQSAALKLTFLATLLGILGVSLWPAYYAKALSFHPWILHSKWMIQGFVGGLSLAILRQNSILIRPHAKNLFATLDPWILLLVALCHGFQKFPIGDGIFSLWLGIHAIELIRTKTGFSRVSQVFWGFSLASGSIGASIGYGHEFLQKVNLPVLGQILLFQSFPAFTMLAAISTRLRANDSFYGALAIGVAVFGFVAMEAAGDFYLGFYGRYLALALALGFLSPFAASSFRTLYQAQSWVLILAVAYVLLRPFYPLQQASFNHLYFMGVAGLALLVLALKQRKSQSDTSSTPFQTRAWKWWTFLIVLATLTRITPVWVPSTTLSHHIYAAITWIIVLIMWMRWSRN